MAQLTMAYGYYHLLVSLLCKLFFKFCHLYKGGRHLKFPIANCKSNWPSFDLPLKDV